MRFLRRFTSLLVRGPDARFIRHDLEEIYARDRAGGLPACRAHLRYFRLLFQSALSVWRPGERLVSSVEWVGEFRTGEALRDVRFGARLLLKHPTSAGIAITGLGMAIGIVVSVFTIVDATMLKPFAMDDPASVVSVGSVRMHGEPIWSYASFLRMQEASALAHIEASRLERVRVSTMSRDGGDVSRRMLFVSGGYLEMLGGRPAYGRPLAARDDAAGATPVVMISHHLWSSALNADPAAIGRTMWVNGIPVTLVGVMRPDFTGPIDADIRPAIWAALSALDDLLGGKALDRDSRNAVEVIGRLRPGASARAAEDNLSAIVNRLRPASSATDPSRSVRLDSLASPMAGRDAAENYLAIVTIFAIVGLVLVLACANTANLLLAAATTRMSEMGTRLALGASTARLVNQMVNESLLLCLAAGGLGLVSSIWLVPVLRAALDLPPDLTPRPDGRVVLFTIGVAVVCGLGAGLSPARHGARGNLLGALRSQGSTNGAGAIPSRLRTTFVGFQAAVSVFLLVAAALLARSAMRATAGAGFDVDRLLGVAIERGNHDTYARIALDAVRRIPFVEHASLVQNQPFSFIEEGDEFSYGGRWYRLNVTRCDASFFATAGLRILRGRAFSDDDVAHEAPVALISGNVARELFPGIDPIGQPLSGLPPRENGNREPATIVGVVSDAMLAPLRSESSGGIYRPIRRTVDNPPVLIVRAPNPWHAARAVEESLRRVDPSKRPTVSIVREGLDAYLGNKRMLASLAVPVAVLALLLAALGVFGVTAFVVSQRTSEMSVRMALGASAADVARLLLGDSLRPVIAGLVVGLGAALLVSTLSSGALGGISPHDPLAIGIGAGSLIVASLVAVVVPVRRAARTDPASLLRTG
jgi:predicted permease